MSKMISLTDHPFDGLSLHAGDEFHAGHEFVEFLIVTGRARVATALDEDTECVDHASDICQKDMANGASADYETREIVSDSPGDGVVDSQSRQNKRPYNRKAVK